MNKTEDFWAESMAASYRHQKDAVYPPKFLKPRKF